jgi:PIN domain nuclease of toxin-antitoxin system
MRYVVDTHALIWYLGNDARLGTNARQILEDPDKFLIVPILVLTEAKHAAERKRVSVSFDTILQEMITSPRIAVFPLDVSALNYLPSQLDIHDSIIVATARSCRDFFGEEVALLTNDRAITESGIVPVIW